MASNVTGTSGKIHKYLIYLQSFSRFYNKIMILQCTINNSVPKIKVNIFTTQYTDKTDNYWGGVWC